MLSLHVCRDLGKFHITGKTTTFHGIGPKWPSDTVRQNLLFLATFCRIRGNFKELCKIGGVRHFESYFQHLHIGQV